MINNFKELFDKACEIASINSRKGDWVIVNNAWGINELNNYSNMENKRVYSDIDPYGEENWDNDEINNNSIFPVVQRLAARTIGLDLVKVHPTPHPILYIDFKYDNFEHKPKGEQIFSDIDPYGEEEWEV